MLPPLELCDHHVVIRGWVVDVLNGNHVELLEQGWTRVDVVDSRVEAASFGGSRTTHPFPSIDEAKGLNLRKIN